MKKTIKLTSLFLCLLLIFVFTGCTTEAKIVSIDITPPAKHNYYVGDETLNLDGGMIIVKYDNNTEKSFSMSDSKATVTGFNTQTTGTKTITVKFSNFTKTFDIEVLAIPVESIDIVDTPDLLQYFIGDTADDIDLTGLKIQVTYLDETSEDITILMSMVTVVEFNTTISGESQLILSYGGIEFTINITIINANIEVLTNLITEFPTIDWLSGTLPVISDEEYDNVITALNIFLSLTEIERAQFDEELIISMAAQVEFIAINNLYYVSYYNFIDSSERYMFELTEVEEFALVMNSIMDKFSEMQELFAEYSDIIIAEEMPYVLEGLLKISTFLDEAEYYASNAQYALDAMNLALDLYENLKDVPKNADVLTQQNVFEHMTIGLAIERIEAANAYDIWLYGDTLPVLLHWLEMTESNLNAILDKFALITDPILNVMFLADNTYTEWVRGYYLNDYTLFVLAFIYLDTAYNGLTLDQKVEFNNTKFDSYDYYGDMYEFFTEEFENIFGDSLTNTEFMQFYMTYLMICEAFYNSLLSDEELLILIPDIILLYEELSDELQELFDNISSATYSDITLAYKFMLLTTEEQAVAEMLIIVMEEYYYGMVYDNYSYFIMAMEECISAYELLNDKTNFDLVLGQEYDFYLQFFNDIKDQYNYIELYGAIEGSWIANDEHEFYEFKFDSKGNVLGSVSFDLDYGFEEYEDIKISSIQEEESIYLIIVTITDTWGDINYRLEYDMSTNTFILLGDDWVELNFTFRKGTKEDFYESEDEFAEIYKALDGSWIADGEHLYYEFVFDIEGNVSGSTIWSIEYPFEIYADLKISEITKTGNIYEIVLVFDDEYYGDAFLYFSYNMTTKNFIILEDDWGNIINLELRKGTKEDFYPIDLTVLYEALEGSWIAQDVWYYFEFSFTLDGSATGAVTWDPTEEFYDYPNVRITNIVKEGSVYTISIAHDDYHYSEYLLEYNMETNVFMMLLDDMGYEMNIEFRRGTRGDFLVEQ